MRALDANVGDAMAQLTMKIRVVGIRRARIRTWMAGKLLILARAVIGCRDMQVEFVERTEPRDWDHPRPPDAPLYAKDRASIVADAVQAVRASNREYPLRRG